MRYVVLAAAVSMLCPAALADEVVLEKLENKAGVPMAYLKTDELNYEKIDAPEGAKAPEGELEWGRLTTGKKSHKVCITVEDKKLTKLYLDADGDNDFTEETPVKLKGSFITIPGMPVEFEVTGGTLVDKTNIAIMQYTPSNGYVGISTKYTGTTEVEGMKVKIDWTPGQKPRLQPEGQKLGMAAYYFGKRKLALEGDSVSLKDGKVVVDCVMKEAEGLVEVQAGSLLEYVTLHQGREGAACIPEEGKVYLPTGEYTVAWGYFSKKVNGDTYELRMLLGSRNFRIKDDYKLGDIEPLALAATARQAGSKVSINAALTSASGGQVTLTKNRKALNPPKLTIKNAKGEEVATHTFKPG